MTPHGAALIYNQTQTITVATKSPCRIHLGLTGTRSVRSGPTRLLAGSCERRPRRFKEGQKIVCRLMYRCWSRRVRLSNRVHGYKTDWTHGRCHSAARRAGSNNCTGNETFRYSASGIATGSSIKSVVRSKMAAMEYKNVNISVFGRKVLFLQCATFHRRNVQVNTR